MNLKFRNHYICMMFVTFVFILIAIGVALFDLYTVFSAISQPSFQLNTESLYKILLNSYTFHIGFVVVLLNSITCYFKSRIGPEFKDAFTPNINVIMLYLTGMTAIHFSGYLTMDYFFASIIILMIFAVITFKKWSTELRLTQELKQKNLSIFEENEESKRTEQAEEKVVINPQVKLLNPEIVTEDMIGAMRQDRKNIFSRPLSFLSSDMPYSVIVYTAKNEQQRKKMKLLSNIGMLCRCIFVSQLSIVLICSFLENHSWEFTIGNLSAPLFWLMATLTIQFHYHSAMMLFVSKEKFKNKIFLRKGLVYFALMGTFLCSLGEPDILITLMSLFYFLSSLWVVRAVEKSFLPELNTIFKGFSARTTTAKN